MTVGSSAGRPDDASRDALKRAAAAAAAALVEPGMLVGLGSGSTAALAVALLGHRVAGGLDITAIATSRMTAMQARRLGIRLVDFTLRRRIDLTIDGADEVLLDGLHLIKGRGGALLREKIVARASRRLVVAVDSSKLVERLGQGALPVEVEPFGWQATFDQLAALAGNPVLRGGAATPFVSDGGHYIIDCAFGPIADPPTLERRLIAVTGVIETGLFLNLATEVLVGTLSGVEAYRA